MNLHEQKNKNKTTHLPNKLKLTNLESVPYRSMTSNEISKPLFFRNNKDIYPKDFVECVENNLSIKPKMKTYNYQMTV